jgi:hypothetical protein
MRFGCIRFGWGSKGFKKFSGDVDSASCGAVELMDEMDPASLCQVRRGLVIMEAGDGG